MVLRVIIVILGVLIAAVGVSLFFLQGFWHSATQTILDSPLFRYWGIVGIVFGLILLVAAAARQVGLLPVMWFLGILWVAAGILVIVNPQIIRNFINEIYLNKPAGSRMFMQFLSGLFRLVAGLSMILAAILRQPRDPILD